MLEHLGKRGDEYMNPAFARGLVVLLLNGFLLSVGFQLPGTARLVALSIWAVVAVVMCVATLWPRNHWRRGVSLPGVDHDPVAAGFEAPRASAFDEPRPRVRNLLRGFAWGRDWLAWEERSGTRWEWRFCLPLRRQVAPHFVEWAGRDGFSDVRTDFPANYSHSRHLPADVAEVVARAGVDHPLDFRVNGTHLVTSVPGMRPGRLARWLDREGAELAHVADLLEAGATPAPEAAAKAITSGDPSRNVWAAEEDDPQAAWAQPRFSERPRHPDR